MRHRNRIAAAAILLLLLLLLLWSQRAGIPGPAPGPVPGPPIPEVAPPARPAVESISGSSPPAPVPAPVPVPVPPPAAASGPAAVRLDLVPLPRRDPDPVPDVPAIPKDGVRMGGGPGSMSPSGWTKWKPVPEKGSVTFRGTVVDAAGRPLPGAEVLRLAPEAGGIEGEVVSFQHVRTVATSKEDGAFEAAGMPAKPARLVANWRRSQNRPKGLLLAGVVPVDPAERETVSGIQLAVPVNRDAFGSIAGRVLDDEGNCIPGVRVFAGYQETRPLAGGGFRIGGVAAGEVEVQVQKYGYAPWRRTVDVPAGGEARVEIVLVPNGIGTREVSGRVVDAAGEPVPNVHVWLGGAGELSRDETTDSRGTFRFRRLPDLGDALVSVSVMADPERAGVLPATMGGIQVPSSGLVLTVDRSAMLRILVRDAATKEILPLFNVDLKREKYVGGETRLLSFRSAALFEEDGAWDVPVPAGRLVLFVEAPDHDPVHAAVDVPAGPGPFEVLVEMGR